VTSNPHSHAGLIEVLEPAPPSLAGGLLRTARPRQWVKNLLVFAAPGAAGLLTEPDVVVAAAGAFAVFCLAASGTYFLNDALGVEADRLHPTKRRRPVAAGTVGVGLAEALGGSLLVASVALSLVLADWRLAAVVALYAAIQPLYSLWLRNLPIVDLAAVASGFVLRAIAGGVAVGVPISQWFLIVTSFGSLFLVSGKRTAEHIDLGEDRGSHRSTLSEYSLGFLHHVRSVSSSVAVAAYCLWALEKAETAPYAIWFQLSIIPFVLATLRYALLLDGGKGGSPEELVFEDRSLQVLGLLWVATVAVGIHAG
jgi:decaprenyl-phosphate phosphoribosyltransferase